MRDVLDPWMNPVTWAVPFFLLFIGIELAALKWLDHDDVTGYQPKDASASILMGLGSLVSTLVLKAAAFFVYIALYLYVAPWHLPMRTWWSWALVIAHDAEEATRLAQDACGPVTSIPLDRPQVIHFQSARDWSFGVPHEKWTRG